MNILGNQIHFYVLSVVFSAATFISGAVQAAQSQAPFKTVYRYDAVTGLKTGVISPDADTDSRNFLAQRYVYGDASRPSLVTEIQSGNLAVWLSDSYAPSQWTGFTIYSIQGFEYDSYGRKSKEWVKDKDGNYEAVTQYAYNAKGLVECKAQRMNKASFGTIQLNACSPDSAGTDGPDRITRYTYNDLDQVKTEERGVGTGLQQTYVTNTYEGLSLKTQTDANGNKTQLDYDPVYGRLTHRYYPSPTTTGAVNYSDYNQYDYDLNGNMKWERKRNGTQITYTIDNNNRVSIKDYNTAQRDIYYKYDLRGLQLRAAFAISESAADATNAERTEQKYDGFGNLIKDLVYMKGTGRAVYGKYDAHNNRTVFTHYDNNNYFTYQYDGLDRLGVIFEGGGFRMLQIDYELDGHRKRIYRRSGVSSTNYSYFDGVRLDGLTQDFPNNAYDLTNTFAYNAASQVTQLTQSNSLYYYSGNEDRTGNYTPDGLNRYAFVSGATQGAGTPLYYDDNSNLNDDGVLTYQYDDENRLTGTGRAATSSFVYDPRGRLFEATINGTKTQFLYDGDRLVAEYDGSGVMQRRYVHGDRVDEPLVQYNSSAIGSAGWRYLHADHQGSIIAQSDVSGNVLSTSSYDSYGIPRSGNNDRFGYTGQIWFKDLGLWYYKARVYHPKLGRFLQTDPIGYKDDYNLYAYVGNDPVNKTDPTGLWTCNKGAEAQCDVVETGLKNAAAAMKNMNKADAAKVGGILKTWGARGQSNHISVASGQTRGAANTSTKNGETTVTINSGLTNNKEKFEASTQHTMASVVVHEGQHIIDERNWGGRNPATKQESYDTERRGMGVEQIVEKAQGFVPAPSMYRAVETDLARRAWNAYNTSLPGPTPISWNEE